MRPKKRSLSTSLGNVSANAFIDKYSLYVSDFPMPKPVHAYNEASSSKSGTLTSLFSGGSSGIYV
jgi:hypothetical protein